MLNQQSIPPIERLSRFCEQVIFPNIPNQIVIFFDEIDAFLSLSWSTGFPFTRYAYNKRADSEDYKRLTIVLLGSASPSDLSKDPRLTPFNIGKAIKLTGFTFEEAQPLARGLEGKFQNPTEALREVLHWTGGQPFLTQKICELIQKSMDRLTVEQLVRQKIIERWESQDNPEHLRTIRDRILRDEKNRIQFLGMYQQILAQGEIEYDGNYEQTKLQITGLVVNQQNKLKVYNPIYAAVFDREWIEGKLSSERPYAQKINIWLNSNCADRSQLLQGNELVQAQEWAKDKKLDVDDYRFLSASEELKFQKIKKIGKLLLISSFSILAISLLGSIINVMYSFYKIEQKELETRLSLGEKVLLPSDIPAKQLGAEYFKDNKFSPAYEKFKEAINSDKGDPETLIYRNNANIQIDHKKYITISVNVPISSNPNAAKETLRGISQAQDEINSEGGIQNQLLAVEISNDGNNKEKSQKIANRHIRDRKIIAVVGHNSSDDSIVVCPLYEKGKLVMISPTSTTSKMSNCGNFIFRTVATENFLAKVLATHINKILTG